eukprot:10336934-Alexandrium_andersonii.AAC.2
MDGGHAAALLPLPRSPLLSVDRSPAADPCSLQFALRLSCCPAALLDRSPAAEGVERSSCRCAVATAAALAAAQLRP